MARAAIIDMSRTKSCWSVIGEGIFTNDRPGILSRDCDIVLIGYVTVTWLWQTLFGHMSQLLSLVFAVTCVTMFACVTMFDRLLLTLSHVQTLSRMSQKRNPSKIFCVTWSVWLKCYCHTAQTLSQIISDVSSALFMSHFKVGAPQLHHGS